MIKTWRRTKFVSMTRSRDLTKKNSIFALNELKKELGCACAKIRKTFSGNLQFHLTIYLRLFKVDYYKDTETKLTVMTGIRTDSKASGH